MRDDSPAGRRGLLADVCEWYYLEGRTQNEIADRLGVSRSVVSRLLTEAQAEGVVEFKIHREPPVNAEVSRVLSRRFGIDADVVQPCSTNAETLRAMGRAAGARVDARLTPSGVLAVSYGTSVYETVRHIPARRFASMQVVQLAGVEGVANPQIDGWELVRICAERLSARYRHLHSPLMVSTPLMRTALFEDPHVREHMEMAAKADVAVVGLGSVDPHDSSLVRAGHLTADQLRACVEAGSVGYIAGNHYDINGRPLDALNERNVSLPLPKLAEISYVIAVAAGPGKVRAIVGALRGGFVDALVTDVPTAEAVMRVADELNQMKSKGQK